MTLSKAIKAITAEWEVLRAAQKQNYGTPKSEAVWIAQSNIAGSYEVDEEWIGIAKDGSIVWAYASGCSCWDGEYSEEHVKTLKEVTLTHSIPPEEWEKAIIAFAETKQMQDLSDIAGKRNY